MNNLNKDNIAHEIDLVFLRDLFEGTCPFVQADNFGAACNGQCMTISGCVDCMDLK